MTQQTRDQRKLFIRMSLLILLVINVSVSLAFAQIAPVQPPRQSPIHDQAFRREPPPVQRPRTFAVVGFKTYPDLAENRWVGIGFGETIATKLASAESALTQVSRIDIHEILLTQEVRMTEVDEKNSMLSEKIARQLNALKGAEYLLVGSVQLTGKYSEPQTPLIVNARVVAVETGEVIQGEAFTMEGTAGEMFNLQADLAIKYIDELGIELTEDEHEKFKTPEMDSVELYRLYSEGMQLFYDGKYEEAEQKLWQAYQSSGLQYHQALIQWQKAGEKYIQTLREQSEIPGKEQESRRIREEALRKLDERLDEASATVKFVRGAFAVFEGKLDEADGLLEKARARYKEAIGFYQEALRRTSRKVLLWKYKTYDWIRGNPTVSNGIVYAGSWHDLYALDAQTGELRWKYETGWYVSSPTVSNGIVYIGSEDDYLYAIDAQTGELKWKRWNRGGCSPTVSNGIVYVASHDEHLYALDAQTGELRWKYKTEWLVFSNPTVYEGIVYIEILDNLYALDAQTGELRWKYKTADLISSGPTVHSGIIYVGSLDYHLYALDAQTREIRWKYKTGGVVQSSPTVDSGIVYVGSKDKHLYAFDAQNGELKCKYETGDEVYSSPTIDNGIVYVSSGDDYLYALDAQTGKLKWKYQVGWGVSSPTVDSGIVYVGSLARYLYAINTKQGFDGITDVDVYLGLGQAYVALGEDKKAVDCYKKVIESKPNFSVSIYFLLIRLYARMGEKAKAIRTWNSVVQYFGDGLLTETRDLYEIAGVLWVHKIGAWVRSSPTVSNGIVYVGAHDKHLYAIDAKNGELKWKYETWDEVYSSPTVDNGIVYVGSNDDHLYAFDTQTGELRWKYRTEGNVGSSPAVSNGIVYVGAESLSEFGYKSMGADYHLYALDAQTGELKWKYKTGSWVFSSPTVDNGIVYFGSYDDHLYALDAQTGELRWKYDTGPVVFSSPTVDNGIIYVGSEDGHLYALDAKTGELRWKYDTEWSVRSSPTVSNGIVYVGSCDKHLYAIDAKTGELRWKYKMGEYTSSSPTVSNGIVYVGAKLWLELGHKSIGHLYAIDAKNGKLRWKYETEWDVTSSPIISNGIAYLGSWDGCLYAFDLAKIDKLLAKGQQWWFISEHDVLSCAQNISEESEKVRWLSSALQFCDYGGALQVGWEFLDLGKYSEARQIAEKLIELEPQNADGYKLLARLDYLKGKYEFAWLNNALQFCDDYRGILQIGREFLSLGRYSEARKVAEKLIELEPANSYFVDGYELLARIDYLEGKYESALKVSQKALELNPKLASAQYTIALIFVRQHQLEPAIKAYEKALKLDTAEILSAAITDLLDALKQEPSLSEAHFALGLLYETNQDYAKAKEHFTLYLQANVESKWAELAREHLKKINEK